MTNETTPERVAEVKRALIEAVVAAYNSGRPTHRLMHEVVMEAPVVRFAFQDLFDALVTERDAKDAEIAHWRDEATVAKDDLGEALATIAAMQADIAEAVRHLDADVHHISPRDALKSLRKHLPQPDPLVEAILDKLHHELPYPTEACALVRIAAREHAAKGLTLQQRGEG